MTGMVRYLIPTAIALLLLPGRADAQDTSYDVKTINFDLWCQEQARLPVDRCDKRLPSDEKNYEKFRDTIEKYEISHLKDKERERSFDSNILHNDPVDEPTSTQNSKPNISTKTNPP
jgi:hypothetical protein